MIQLLVDEHTDLVLPHILGIISYQYVIVIDYKYREIIIFVIQV